MSIVKKSWAVCVIKSKYYFRSADTYALIFNFCTCWIGHFYEARITHDSESATELTIYLHCSSFFDSLYGKNRKKKCDFSKGMLLCSNNGLNIGVWIDRNLTR